MWRLKKKGAFVICFCKYEKSLFKSVSISLFVHLIYDEEILVNVSAVLDQVQNLKAEVFNISKIKLFNMTKSILEFFKELQNFILF